LVVDLGDLPDTFAKYPSRGRQRSEPPDHVTHQRKMSTTRPASQQPAVVGYLSGIASRSPSIRVELPVELQNRGDKAGPGVVRD
jgi:hypothetical protein